MIVIMGVWYSLIVLRVLIRNPYWRVSVKDFVPAISGTIAPLEFTQPFKIRNFQHTPNPSVPGTY